MHPLEALRLAADSILSHKLRSFFTLLGIIVSVAFLVAVVAIIQGMNAYVRENLADAIVGRNAFQVRRTPIALGLIDDETLKELQRRPIIAPEDVPIVERALPDAEAVALQSGFPFPQADVVWRNRTVGDAQILGITAPYLLVQDYNVAAGEPITDVDVRERRPVAVLGWDVATKLFDEPDRAVGRKIRIVGNELVVKGVIAQKGTVLGQSWDGFVMLPYSTFEAIYGRRRTTVIAVKMPTAAQVPDAMARAEEAMRIAHHLRPAEPDDFTVDTAEGLISFWQNLTRVLFTVVPAVVAIGVRQFLAESVTLAILGGALGLAAGSAVAGLIHLASPLPARVTWWSVSIALGLGASVGVLFGVYPASRAARLDPIIALRFEQ
jgi:putative ABC transport system permease protein